MAARGAGGVDGAAHGAKGVDEVPGARSDGGTESSRTVECTVAPGTVEGRQGHWRCRQSERGPQGWERLNLQGEAGVVQWGLAHCQ